MLNFIKKNGLALIVFFLLVGCHKDEETFETKVSSTLFTAVVLEEIKGNVSGLISDESGLPVEGALVQIYSATTKTNKYGYFEFNNVGLDKNGTYLTAKKDGFFLGSDMLYPDKAEVYAYVKMIKLESPSTISATSGGTINIKGGGTISLQGNGFISADGKSYNGNVKIHANLIAPSDKDLNEKMPGALIGDRLNKETVALGTYGMIAVELYSEDGKKLQLSKDKPATVKIPALPGRSTSNVETWHFDESLGRWKEVGLANLVNGFYEFKASHFSFWNVDAPFPLVNVCGAIKFENGDPVKNARIQVIAEGLNTASGITDASGRYCGKMPKGKALVFKIFSAGCDNSNAIVEKTIGSLTGDTEIPVIAIPNNSIQQRTINAKVVCNTTAVKNAKIVVDIEGKLTLLKTDDKGLITENISHLACGAAKKVTAFAFDPISGDASAAVELKVNDNTLNTFDLCKIACNFTAEIKNNCNGKMTAIATNGSGNYTYKWSNGATTNEITITPNSGVNTLYCVTITDVSANCTKNICKTYEPFGGAVESCGDTARVFLRGGERPFTYLWGNGATDSFLVNKVTAQTSLSLIVTDKNGCTFKSNAILLPRVKIDALPTTCNKEFYTLKSSIAFSNGFVFPDDDFFSEWDSNFIDLPIKISSINNLSVFVTGFSFKISAGQDGECEGTYVELPRLKKFKVKETDVTCGTCNDGYITIVEADECRNCTFGSVKILKADRKTDVTADNDKKQLPKGIYYAVAEDKSGCYVEFKKVQIK
jgi:hypothetical protein